MNPDEIERQVRRAIAAGSWSEFEGYLEPLEERILQEDPDRNALALIEAERRLASEPPQPHELATALIADFFAQLVSPGALRLGVERLEGLEGRGGRQERLAPASDDARRPWESAVAGIARKLRRSDHVDLRGSPALERALENTEPRPVEPGSRNAFLIGSEGATPSPAYQLVLDKTGLRSGDVVFRKMNIPVVRILGTFGHAGVYVGRRGEEHVVAEMQMNARGGECRIVTLADFKKAAGAQGYWGGYSVDLDDSQRSEVVRTALSYVGVATYGFVSYKDPSAARFRCDGLPEHCYEMLRPPPQRLAHRGGLFEEDRWNTMSPASLRNCMFNKIYP